MYNKIVYKTKTDDYNVKKKITKKIFYNICSELYKNIK